MKLSLGLDIGASSIGFALIDMENGEIVESNSVIFHRKETTVKENRTLQRRQSRTGRRLIARRSQRKRNFRKLLYRYNFVEKEFIDNPKKYIKHNAVDNLFYLRSKATNKALSDYELARILYAFSNKRGYSDRYDLDEKDKGVIANAIADNQNKLKEYNTFGEMMWSVHPKKCRNSNNDYSRLATMKDIKHEIKFILEKQKSLGNTKITNEFISEVLSENTYKDNSVSLFYQRPLKEISGQVGLCSYQHYLGYKRASKATHTFLEYVFLEKLHNTHVVYKDNECSLFSIIDDFPIALQKFIKNSGKFNVTFIKSLFDKKVIKDLVIKLDKNNEAENRTLGKESCSLIKIISNFDKILHTETIDEIATILTIYQDVEQKKENLYKKLSLYLSDKEIEILATLDFKGFGRLSLETMRSMIPLMKNGSTPYEAKKECGFTLATNTQQINFLPPLNCDKKYIEEELIKKVPSLDIESFIPFYDAMGNPVVSRVISVLRKVINQIIKDYGIPERIVIEMARDYNSVKEKKEIDQAIKKNNKLNNDLKKEIENNGFESNIKNIEKYRYWKEQKGYCLYSGVKIPIQELFSENVEVEHVLPRSKVFINSNKNKIVVFKKENQNKSNLYHYEYLKKNHQWNDFCTLVKGLLKDKFLPNNKGNWLLREDFTNISKDSYLNDTKYATRLISKYLEYYLYPSEDIHRTGFNRAIFSVNGKATSFFRKHWGLQNVNEDKDRSNHYHHAIDAIVLASITPKMINNISSFFKAKEQHKKVKFDMPYDNFRKDISDLIEQYQKNEKFVYHYQKIKKNVIAYDNPISTVVINGKEFERKRKNLFEFIENIKKEFNKPKNKLTLDMTIDLEIAKIIDNSTDKFIVNTIKDKIVEILELENKINNLNSYKKEIKNDQDEIETINNKIKDLQAKIDSPFVVLRGKKQTPQIVKSFLVIGQGAGIYNNVFNKKDLTIQKRKNKESVGLEVWAKDDKKYCVRLTMNSIWSKCDKISKNGIKINDSFTKILTMYPDTLLEVKKDNKVKYVLYSGVGSGSQEDFSYKEINNKVKNQPKFSINSLDYIKIKKMNIYGNILDK